MIVGREGDGEQSGAEVLYHLGLSEDDYVGISIRLVELWSKGQTGRIVCHFVDDTKDHSSDALAAR